ncbi:AEC family transporter [Ruicaihuangia caeni]|uniref:AEC family transporter n=1 Tax=Ruicaihuangia caeni TaxID=3042517 RepID=UPI00338E5387
MLGVLVGFAIIAVIIATGYLVRRTGLLGDEARYMLAKLVFFVLSPCLLLTVIADADPARLFSPLMLASLLAALSVFLVMFLVVRFVWRRKTAETVVTTLAAGYVNANNIGIPVAVYVLGDAAWVAPVILLQLLLITPLSLTALDLSTRGGVSVGRILAQPFRNPIIIGSAIGLVLALTKVPVPEAALEPFRIMGAAAVPLMLMNYGMSLHGQRLLQPGTGRRDVLTASALKLFAMPLAAWLLGSALGISGHELFVVVALAALPTAQNVFNYAQRYGRGETVARDTILITTVGSVAVLAVAAALLH